MKKIKGIIYSLIFLFFVASAMVGFQTETLAKDQDGDIVVIIDPGHGGNDGGAQSVTSGANESGINWEIATALKAELETYAGVKVYLTRGSAEWLSNTGRGRYGVSLGADLFVSVHNNSGSATASGVEVYGTVNAQLKAQTQKLCEMIAAEVSAATGLTNRGYKTRSATNDASKDYYTMLDEAAKSGIPGLIIEHAFLSNASDAAFLDSRANRLKLGAADATAIAKYFGLSKRTVSAGSSLTLTRTYSAYMTGALTGTYSSSDEKVAYVREDGLITAVSAGKAVITCTAKNGDTESVTVTVPETAFIGIVAGINPTFYATASEAANYKQSTVMVKAVYSDGSAVQVSNGVTFGSFPAANGNAYDIPISYKGKNGTLRVYVDAYSASISSAGNNHLVTGTNTDILVLPGIYAFTGNSGGGTTELPTTAPVKPPETQAPTEAPKPTESVTKEPVEPTKEETEAGTEKSTEEESVTEGESVTEELTEEVHTKEPLTEDITGNGTKEQDGAKGSYGWLIAVVGLGVIAAAGIAGLVILIVKKKKGRR